MKPPQTPPFYLAPIPLLEPPSGATTLGGGGGSLLESENDNADFKEEEDMESLVSYGKCMCINNLLLYLIVRSPNGEEEDEIDLVCDTTWLIQNPQWGFNLHWISAANK